ncbi:unnamed protein product [Urochloa humidicola]
MSLARAYERRATVVTDLMYGTAPTSICLKPRAPKAPSPYQASKGATTSSLPEGATVVGAPVPASSSMTSTTPRATKKLTAEDTQERCRLGLCFNCDEQYSRGHKCKRLF